VREGEGNLFSLGMFDCLKRVAERYHKSGAHVK
jgi:hypothetical protein